MNRQAGTHGLVSADFLKNYFVTSRYGFGLELNNKGNEWSKNIPACMQRAVIQILAVQQLPLRSFCEQGLKGE